MGIKMNRSKLIKVLTFIYLVPFIFIIGFNVFNSLTRTTYFDLHQYIESAKYKWDNPIITLIAAAVILWLLFFIIQIKTFDANKIAKISLIWAGSFCLCAVLLFRCIAKCDSDFLSKAAIEFLQGNYQSFEAGGYLHQYPFQLGFTAVMELIYKIFGVENYIVFELLNIVCIVDALWVLGQITLEIYGDEDIYKLEMMLGMGLFPFFLLATFIYGDIPGWCMGINAIYRVIRYLKTEKYRELFIASLWLMGGLIMKTNLSIIIVATVIIVTLHAINKKNIKILLPLIGLLIISQLGNVFVNSLFRMRTGQELPEGIPKIAWVAMGMQESDIGGAAAGWYNGYNTSVYKECGYDRQLTTETCMNDIEHSLKELISHPRHGLPFLYQKFTSQWNDPTFLSMLTNEWYSRNVQPQSDVAIFFLYGKGRNLLIGLMNIYHFLIFLGVAVWGIGFLKKWELETSYLVLNIFGGLMFHMIWEAKSRYVLLYFILLLPLAASGYFKLFHMLKKGENNL